MTIVIILTTSVTKTKGSPPYVGGDKAKDLCGGEACSQQDASMILCALERLIHMLNVMSNCPLSNYESNRTKPSLLI